MRQQVVPIVLILLLLLGILSPFSALAALMLLAVGSLLYGLVVAVVRGLVEPQAVPAQNPDSKQKLS